MTDLCLPLDPTPLVIDRLTELMRTGFPSLPGFPESSSWTDPADTAPAGHWVLSEGCHIYRGDAPDEIAAPSCIVYQMQPAVPTNGHTRLFWLVPVTIELHFSRAIPDSETRDAAQLLQLALCEDVRYTSGNVSTARSRLSCPGLRVRGVRSVEIELPAIGGADWTTVSALHFTLFCSALAVPANSPD